MAYKFMFYDENRTVEHTLEDQDENFVEIVKTFNEFLRGCGFEYPGTIELVPYRTDEPPTEGRSDVNATFVMTLREEE